MVMKRSDDLVFFCYPDREDTYVSASIKPNSYWDKNRSDEFCREFSTLDGRADFLDVGANIGTWSIPMARCLQDLNHGGSVIAVEAMPSFGKHLVASIRANKFD